MGTHDTECPPGQYSQFGKCYPCSPGCKECGGFYGTCTSCDDGWHMVHKTGSGGGGPSSWCETDVNLQATTHDTNCPPGQYSQFGKCYPCYPGCKECGGLYGTCTSCDDGWHLVQKTGSGGGGPGAWCEANSNLLACAPSWSSLIIDAFD